MTPIPAAVLHTIATTTGADPRHGRHARTGACRRCAAPVVRGLDEDMCAFHAAADPHRLTPAGELLALVAARATYTLSGRPPQLLLRDRWRIRGNPADRCVVLAEHECGAPPLPAYPNQADTSPVKKVTADAPF